MATATLRPFEAWGIILTDPKRQMYPADRNASGDQSSRRLFFLLDESGTT